MVTASGSILDSSSCSSSPGPLPDLHLPLWERRCGRKPWLWSVPGDSGLLDTLRQKHI